MLNWRTKLAAAALVFAIVTCAGCGAAEDKVAAAYEQGYADGLAAAGSQDESEQMPSECGDCYALGFREGYDQGYADGSAAG